MIRRSPNLLLRLLFVFYGRMSSDDQNPRSPEQQLDTCLAELERQGYPWIQVGSYIDRGVSGRLVRQRDQFWQMITDIRTGKIKPDVIVVDTFERFGRAEELEQLRHELATKYGVLVMTADSRFADPTSVAGKALSSFEAMRATEDNRVKAHNVLRGKKDAVRRGHWPGGKPPFGLQLQSVMIEKDGRQEVDHHVLVKNPATNWIVAKAFRTADERCWGSTRVTRFLDQDSEIPAKFKPFNGHSVHRWLSDPIYVGRYDWAKYCTDVINDRRVIEKNDPADVLRIPNFCEATVAVEVFERVQALRLIRAEGCRIARRAAKAQPDKLIRPIAPGLALKFPLSGLIRCARCNRAMTISSSPEYVTKGGVARRYAAYHCPASHTHNCSNRARIPEPWLRSVVIDLLLRRLFGVPGS